MSCGTQVSRQRFDPRIRGYHPLWPTFPRRSPSVYAPYTRPYNPDPKTGLGSSAFARHYSRNPLFSSGYLDVSVHPVPSPRKAYDDMTRRGFPHSDISGSTLTHSSPELFAVYHVLLRHLTPRHPPCALIHFCTCDTEKLILSRYYACIRLLSCVPELPPAANRKSLCAHPPISSPVSALPTTPL